MKKPYTLNVQIGELSCGVYAVASILQSFGYDIKPSILEKMASKAAVESTFGALYSIENVIKFLEYTRDSIAPTLQIEIKEFSKVDELKSIIDNNVKENYILLPYYAMQGNVVVHNKVNMTHGHWSVIYDIKNERVYGTQSNRKAEALGVLDGVDISKLYESNKCLGKIKVDYGKYNKCNICIARAELGIKPRCGKDSKDCEKLKYTRTDGFKCIYNTNLSGKAILIGNGNSNKI